MSRTAPWLAVLAVMFAAAALAADEPNPYTGRQKRVGTFPFAAKPTIVKTGDGYLI